MSRPDLYLEKFRNAGADTIQIHLEADCDVHTELHRIRELGAKNALVINPETPVEATTPYLAEIDEILVMTVHPGYGGQKFIADCMPKVRWLRERLPEIDIMVDGGVNAETAPVAIAAGVNQLVAGSYLFGKEDMAAAIEGLRRNGK
jgi:ribulose-phosphate 3-epimerase